MKQVFLILSLFFSASVFSQDEIFLNCRNDSFITAIDIPLYINFRERHALIDMGEGEIEYDIIRLNEQIVVLEYREPQTSTWEGTRFTFTLVNTFTISRVTGNATWIVEFEDIRPREQWTDRTSIESDSISCQPTRRMF
jgi:hypothetical protein